MRTSSIHSISPDSPALLTQHTRMAQLPQNKKTCLRVFLLVRNTNFPLNQLYRIPLPPLHPPPLHLLHTRLLSILRRHPPPHPPPPLLPHNPKPRSRRLLLHPPAVRRISPLICLRPLHFSNPNPPPPRRAVRTPDPLDRHVQHAIADVLASALARRSLGSGTV